jgi:hypothetical protein
VLFIGTLLCDVIRLGGYNSTASQTEYFLAWEEWTVENVNVRTSDIYTLASALDLTVDPEWWVLDGQRVKGVIRPIGFEGYLHAHQAEGFSHVSSISFDTPAYKGPKGIICGKTTVSELFGILGVDGVNLSDITDDNPFHLYREDLFQGLSIVKYDSDYGSYVVTVYFFESIDDKTWKEESMNFYIRDDIVSFIGYMDYGVRKG